MFFSEFVCTQQAILRFFAPQGRHDSRISMKFGTAEGTKKRKNAKISHFFAPQGRTPRQLFPGRRNVTEFLEYIFGLSDD